jgi:1-acyl-sn-glycerol-3-phosphate acyltransferase
MSVDPNKPPLRLRQRLARALLRASGWSMLQVDVPPRRCVLVSAPHTSNWDTYWMLLAATALGIRIRFAIKEEWMRPPIGWLLTAFGALSVRRDGTLGMTDRLIREFEGRDDLLLAIAPAGTRKQTDRWRSGFYQVAKAAGVPLVLGVVDYGSKRAGVGPTVPVTGDVGADMDVIRSFYAGVRARFPNKQSVMRLRDEGGE